MTKLLLNDKMEDLVDLWHMSDTKLPLHEFLGVSLADYGKWVENPNFPLEREETK